MEWIKFDINNTSDIPERVKLFGISDEGEYRIIRWMNGRFDTYLNITWYCIPDPILETAEEKPKSKRGRKKKT